MARSKYPHSANNNSWNLEEVDAAVAIQCPIFISVKVQSSNGWVKRVGYHAF